MAKSPTLEGLRVAFRRPAFTLAEISWRWAFGAAACFLFASSLLEYLNSLTVTSGDLFFLRSRHPFLISQALLHILGGGGRRLIEAAVIMLPALAILWIISASLGGAAILKPLLAYCGRNPTVEPGAMPGLRPGRIGWWRLRSLVGLNFLRAALFLAAVLGVLGAAIIASLASSRANPHPGLAFVTFALLALLVVSLWASVNWFLSLAGVFVMRDGQDAFGALGAVMEFCQRRALPIVSTSSIFALLHGVALVIASSVVLLPLGFLTIIPPGFVFLAIVLVLLVYFGIVDFFYTGRRAAYLAILEMPDEPMEAPIIDLVQPTVPSSTSAIGPAEGRPLSPVPSSDDDILSDIPGLVPPQPTSG